MDREISLGKRDTTTVSSTIMTRGENQIFPFLLFLQYPSTRSMVFFVCPILLVVLHCRNSISREGMATQDWVCTIDTYVKLWFQKLKLWVVEKLKNQSSKSMLAHGSKSGVKTWPQNCQKLENVFGKIEIFLAQNLIFLAWNSIFFNGFPISKKSKKIFFNSFPISSMAFPFLWRISTFRNGFLIFLNGFPIFLNSFPLSEKSRKIYLWRQVYKISLSELRISAKITIFRDKNNWRQEYKRSLSKLRIFCSELCNSC